MKILTTFKYYPTLRHIALCLYSDFKAGRCVDNAAALTLTTLLSLVPLFTVLYAALKLMPGMDSLGEQMEVWLFQQFVPSRGDEIRGALQEFSGQTSNLTIAGSTMLIVTSSLMLARVEACLNAIWQVKPAAIGIGSFLRYWTILSLGPILIGVGVFLTSYVASIKILGSAVELLGMKGILLSIFPFALTVIAFSLIYVAVPNCYVPFKSACIGAFIAAALFEIGKRIFAWYITEFPSYELIYGAFAALPIFLVWINLCWVILLLGGVVSRTFAVNVLRSTKVPDLFAGLELLRCFHNAQHSGVSLSESQIFGMLSWLSRYQWDRLRDLLEKKKIIVRTSKDAFVLSRSLDSLTQFEALKIFSWVHPQNENMNFPAGFEISEKVRNAVSSVQTKLKEEEFHQSVTFWFDESKSA